VEDVRREITEQRPQTPEATEIGRSPTADLLHRHAERPDRPRPVPSGREHEHARLEQAAVEVVEELVELVFAPPLPSSPIT